MTTEETSGRLEITQSPLRLLLLILSAFFLSWGPGLQKVSSFNLSKLFPFFAALLIIYWLLFGREKFRSFPPAFNIFILFVLLHTLICYLFFHPGEFTFSYRDSIYSQAGFLLLGASHGIMVVRFFLFVFFSYAAASLLRSRREVAIIAWSLGLGLLLAMILGSHESLDLTRGFSRATGGFLNPNALALTSLVCLFLNLYSIKCDRVGQRGKIVSGFIIIISIYGLLSTVSRTPLLSLAVGLIVMGFLLPLSTKLRLLTGLLITVIIVIAYLPPEIRQTMKNRVTLQQLEETRGSKRLDIWSDYLREFPRYALTGMGLDRSIEAIRDSYTADSSHPLIPHETYFQVLVEFGFIGLLLVLAALGQFWRRSLRGSPGERAVILGLLAALIAYGVAGSILGDRSVWLALGVIAFLQRGTGPSPRPKPSPPEKEMGIDIALTHPLRILMVIPRLEGGGAERQLGYLSRGISELGHEVTVATFQKKTDPPPEWSGKIRLHWLGEKSNYDPRLFLKLSRLISRVNPDIIQTWNPQTDILGGAAANLASRRWIIREPTCAAFYRSGWKAKLRARLGAKAAAIISNSTGGDDYWRARYPDKAHSIVPNGIPLASIRKIHPIPRVKLGIRELQKFILSAGRITRQKRVDRLLNALAGLDPGDNTVAVICGEGEELSNLRAQTRKLGLENRVIFRGFLKTEEIWALMKSADLFINLSEFEGMPNTVMEAMACNCPLLVSDIPAHREFLDKKSAFLVNPDDLDEMTQRLQSALTDREESRKRAGVAAKKAARWSINRMAEAYEQVYREVIKFRYRKPEK